MQTNLNKDFTTVKYPARAAAEEILADLKKGDSVQVYKTTQAGASTNILGAAADTLEESICIIGPTTNSVTEVIKNAIEHCDKAIYYAEDGEQMPNDVAVCGNIPGNDKCPMLLDLVTKHPAVTELPLPLKECNTNCRYWGLCQNTCLLDAEPKIIGVTKAKLAACLMVNKRDQLKNEARAEEDKEPIWSLGSLQLREIRKARLLVWDEGHSLEYPESKHIEIYNETDQAGLDLDKLFGSIINSEEGKWKSLKLVIETVKNTLGNPKLKEKVGELIVKTAQDTKYSKLMNFKILNPCYKNTHSIESLDFYMGVSEELIQLIVDIDDKHIAGLNHDAVYLLRDLFYMIGCKDLNLVQYRDGGKSLVGITVIDYFTDSLLRKFVKEANDKYHKNIFLSATYGEFNYNSLLGNGKKMKQVIFGRDGDPTRSCTRQVIIPDSYKLQHDGRNSLYARMEEMMQRVCAILDQHGELNCVILANSAREMDKIKQHPLIASRWVLVDYYRSPHTMSTRYYYKIMGEKHYPHVMICIGGAETPTHCKDVYASNLSMSKRMRKAEIFQTLYQTWGRVKNSGNSLVYCLGINQETVEQAIRWGPGYRIILEEDGKRTNYKVGVAKKLASPLVRICRDDEERLAVGREHLQSVSLKDIMNNKTSTQTKPKIYLESCEIVKVSPLTSSLCKVSPVSDDSIEIYTNELLNSMPLLLDIEACTPNTSYTTNPNHHQENEGNLHSHICEELTFTICHFLDPGNDEIKHQLPKSIEPLHTCKSEIEEVKVKAAIEEQLNIAMQSIKIAENGFDYEDGRLFVWDCFCHCTTMYAEQTWSRNSKHWDYFPVREYDRETRMHGRLYSFTMGALYEHMFGAQTYGMYTIADDDTVINVCWDIDAHFNKDAGMTEEQYQAALDGAQEKLDRLVNYLTSHGFDPKIEKSGSPGSYHVWLICKPVRAAIAHWFGNAVLDYLGYHGDEMNPKQATIAQGTSSKRRANGYDIGNLVKLPLGVHKKNKGLSYILIDGYWMRYDVVCGVWVDEYGQWQDRPQWINVRACDLSGIEIPAEAEPKKYNTQNNSRASDWVPTGNMRPFVIYGLKQCLEGPEGHMFRVVAMYEALFNAGLSREQTIDLFRPQADFNYESTAKYVDWVINSGHSLPYGPREEIPEKVGDMCPNIIGCFRAGKPYIWTDYFDKVK